MVGDLHPPHARRMPSAWRRCQRGWAGTFHLSCQPRVQAVLPRGPWGWVEGPLVSSHQAWLMPAHLLSLGKADFSVFAPDKPLLAVVGEEVDLPCHLSLNISAEDMELRWYRDQPSPAMHLHKNGIDVQDEQMAEYQGRTTFLSTRLAQGQAAVRIHNVTALDNGTFHCNFKDGIMSAETTLWLRVAGEGQLLALLVSPSACPQSSCPADDHPFMARA